MKNEKTITATSDKAVKAVRSLIIINNDRYEGYQKAAKESKDGDLITIFDKYSLQSRGFRMVLEGLISDSDLPKDDATKNSGKLFRTWMEVKNNLAGNERKAVLTSCEFGEDEAKKAYDKVLEDTSEIPSSFLEIIREQRAELAHAHDTIKGMRDSA